MATLSLIGAAAPILLAEPELVRFGAPDAGLSATNWSWITLDGHDLDLFGSGLTYDAGGRALTGTVNEVRIDLGNNDFVNPDIRITGLNLAAPALDDSPEAFWDAVLGGNDVINGPFAEKVGDQGTTTLFGDGISASADATSGGQDFMSLGTARLIALGDVGNVGNAPAGSVLSYTGGNDQIFGAETTRDQAISGDVQFVQGGGVFSGGADLIEVRSSNAFRKWTATPCWRCARLAARPSWWAAMTPSRRSAPPGPLSSAISPKCGRASRRRAATTASVGALKLRRSAATSAP